MAELTFNKADYLLFKTPYGTTLKNIIMCVVRFNEVVEAGQSYTVNLGNAQQIEVFNHSLPVLIASNRDTPIPSTLDPDGWKIEGDDENYYLLAVSTQIIITNAAKTFSVNLSNGANITFAALPSVLFVDGAGKIFYMIQTSPNISSALVYDPATSTDFGTYLRPNYYLSYSTTITVNAADMARYSDIFNSWYNQSKEPEDPYAPIGPSEPGGGTGTFDFTSDNTGFSTLPSLSSVDTGFITIFKPTAQELKNLAGFMWNQLDLNNWTKLFNDPMDAILGLSIIPFVPDSGGYKTVTIGNIVATSITMDTVASQYKDIDCGSLEIEEIFGSYLDYDPFTKFEIFLPYIGMRPIKADDVMGKTVAVKYHVDILSGACVAEVECGGNILYSYAGQCSTSIPITGKDWTNVINGVMQIAGSIGAMVATEGAAAPFVAGQLISGTSSMNKENIERSGAMSGAAGLLGYQTPYLVRTVPNLCVPGNQFKVEGYPLEVYETLGDLSGFTSIDNIRLKEIPATEPELAEIYTLLKEGVIL